jgi:hypothetical protein
MAKACTTQRELSRALKVSDKAVSQYVRRDDWPVSRRPPWDPNSVAAIKAWRAGLQEDRAKPTEATAATGPDPGLDLKRPKSIDYRLKLERTKKLRLEREIKAGQYVRRELLEAALVALAREFVQVLEEEEKALPLQVAGRDPGQVEAIVTERFRRHRQRLSEKQSIELQRVRSAVNNENKPKHRGRRKHK